jgi:ankyrin repeat protein
LSEAPDGLSDVYDNITARISTGGTYSTQLALSVITWVFVARRPLSFLELQHALAVQLGDKDIDREDLIDDISYIISACAGLVTVDSVNGAVRLIHYTFSDYLKWRRQALFMEGADARLADICLTYLLFDTFSTGYLSTDQEVEARLSNYPFLEYAAKYWGEHYRLSLEEFQNKDLEESSASQTKSVPDSKLVPQLMTQKGNFSCAVQFLQLPKERGLGYSQRPPRKASTLWLVSSFGLLDLTKKELSELGHENVKKKIQDKTSNEETALYAAVCNRHEKVVKILLRAGANPATCGGEFGSALQAASALGYEDMVRLLMTKENVNATCGTYGTALQAAAAHGREEIVSLLLKEHADVNLLAGKYGTALKAASSTGYENVVQILLENNAKVEVEDPSETTQTATDTSALFNATIMGSESIVRLLLEHGADVNKTGGTSGNLRPLHKAVQSGNLAIVTLLLEHGADVSANSKEGTALHWAARFGDFNMARLLLEFGADVEARDERDRTPLFLAAEETDTPSVAKLLLSAGANCETKDKEESTPLIAAAIRGNEHIVSLLYENGADIEARNSNGTRPLLAAASNGNALVVAFLLSRGADTEVEDSEGATPLIAAANNGHVQVAYILLQHGVQFTSETWESSELSSQAREVLERAVAKGLLKSPSNGHGNWEFLQSLWGNRSKSGNQSTATTDSKIKVSESGEKNELEAVGVWADSDNPALLVENHSEMEELD